MNRKWKRMYIQLIIVLLITFALSYYITGLLKNVTKVPRPCVGLPNCPPDYSFPSRHAVIAFALTVAFMLETKNRVLSTLFAVISIVIAAERVITVVHSPADVIAGALIGITIGYAVQRIYLFLRFYYSETREIKH